MRQIVCVSQHGSGAFENAKDPIKAGEGNELCRVELFFVL